MITFHAVRFKNFLSFGDQWTEIRLDAHQTTLITGDNGSGKSTFLDAISFALYGKPFRKINKPQIVNSINNKKCLVELDFTSGHAMYTVRRGIKPNVFVIEEDGEELDQDAAVADYQGRLERDILKMNYTAFKQVVILGKADYTPFLRLAAGERRKVVEDLLGLKIFSVMNDVLKGRVRQQKDKARDVTSAAAVLSDKVSTHEDYRDRIVAGRDADIRALRAEAAAEQPEIDRLSQEITDSIGTLEELQSAGAEGLKQKAESKLAEARKLWTKLGLKAEELGRKSSFLEQNTNCPTCLQAISDDFRDKQIQTFDSKIVKLEQGMAQLNEEKERLGATIHEQQQILDEIGRVTMMIRTQEQLRKMKQQAQAKAYSKIQDLENLEAPDEAELSELREQLTQVEGEKLALADHAAYLTAIAGLLKDSGIKALIVSKYLPIFNRLINQYLNLMGFFIQFQLDDQFNETILSRFRDSFSYASFSEGQKLRIDLAILLTWREVAKLKNSLRTNLLIMDEVFDSSLDQTGVDAFMGMIPEMEHTNVFIVSHTPDKLADKFRDQLHFKIVNEFSVMTN